MSDQPSIYEQLRAAGVPLDHHGSDLYAEATPEAEQILEDYEYRRGVQPFTDRETGQRWFDIPFAFDPYWRGRTSVA